MGRTIWYSRDIRHDMHGAFIFPRISPRNLDYIDLVYVWLGHARKNGLHCEGRSIGMGTCSDGWCI